MIADRLSVELDRVAARYARLWNRQAYAAALLVCSLVAILCTYLGYRRWLSSWGGLALVSAIPVFLTYLALRSRYLIANRHWVSRQIEARYPDLDSCLLAAVEQSPSPFDGRYGYLQASVIQQALEHAVRHDWSRVVSRRRMALTNFAAFGTFAVFILAVTLAPRLPVRKFAQAPPPPRRPVVASGTFAVSIEPGSVEVERGTSLQVLARVQGPLPADATLIYQPAGSDATRLGMSASLDDPIFGGRIPAVVEPLAYHVELGGHVSPTYQVTVFEYPRLERADARLVYPQYTGLETRMIQDVRTVSVVEGTEVTLICRLNKVVKSALLTEAGQTPVTLQADPGKLDYQVTFRPSTSRRMKLELVDEAGRQNVDQVTMVVNVVPNQPPTLKLVAPGRDLEVSPLEELDLKATAWDDFGLKRMGISVGLAGEAPADVVLGENVPARVRQELANLVRFEDLKAQPDQLLAYHFWAEDFGPDGQLRRTSSDMYFAEVRQFDEIFREGQPPPGGQSRQQQSGGGQNAQAAQQLAQLQKDIINATWKLIRRETGSQPTPPFAEDVKQVADSQSTALEQADALSETIRDPDSQAHLLAVLTAMQEAVKHLQLAGSQPALAELQPALAAEQSAYQALLKLRAREHEVVRQQQSSSSSASQAGRSSQQRQQMQQLDLKDEQNRYETQSLAQSEPENAADRETRQVLNRLKELARRQHDLNERLKDLQSALEEAQTAEKKEEVRQQLKRLQDEQREMLRDTDELQSRMDSPENQEQMAEERQQLEQARDQVQRTSESLEQNQVTQAAASGTRAEKEFEELRNEFRRRASGRFREELREMRDTARDLDTREKQLSEQLAETTQPDPTQKTLRDENRTDDIAKGVNEQRTKLSQLNERLKETILEAEQTEPLLSEKLNDAARNLIDQKVERALEATEQSLRRGFMDDARQLEQLAGRGLNQLREGIEKAAESVLGDEEEALRRAREKLKELARELSDEIARNAPDEAARLAAGQPRGPGETESPEPGPATEPGPASNSPTDDQRAATEQAGTEAQSPSADLPADTNRDGRRAGASRQVRPAQTDQPNAGQPGQPQPAAGDQESQTDAPESTENGQPGSRESAARKSNSQRTGQRQPGQRPPNGQGNGNDDAAGQQPPDEESQPREGTPQNAGQEARPATGRPPQPGSPEQRPGTSPAQRGQQPMSLGQPGPGQSDAAQSGQASSPAAESQPQAGGAEPGDSNPAQGNNPPQQGSRAGGSRGGPQRGGPRAGNVNNGGYGGVIDRQGEPVRSPIGGQDFIDWSDRLRDVEEMVDDPELRAEAARIRDAARSIRIEMKRHSSAPQWNLVRVNVAEPLVELSNRVADELLRRQSKQALVPLDRDPVPPKYSEKTRKYYERLGSGQ